MDFSTHGTGEEISSPLSTDPNASARQMIQKLRNLKMLLRPVELFGALYFMNNTRASTLRDHLHLTADAVLSASKYSPDGGYSMSYSLYLQWAPGYVETTGYLIPTVLDLAETLGRDELRADALKHGEWLLSHQYDEGGFPGASRDVAVVFDTAQVLIGLQRLNLETRADRYHSASLRAADWLASQMHQSLTLGQHTAARVLPTYNARSAGILLAFGLAQKETRFVEIGEAFLSWTGQQMLPSGLFKGSQLGDNEDFLLHTSMYVLEGFLLGYVTSGSKKWLELAIQGAEPFIRACEKSQGILFSHYDERMQPTESDRCPVGLSQWACVCLQLFEITGEPVYAQCANAAIGYVKTKQLRVRGALRGAIPGSVPFWGRYERMAFPNWALKYFADALLYWDRLGLDSDNELGHRTSPAGTLQQASSRPAPTI